MARRDDLHAHLRFTPKHSLRCHRRSLHIRRWSPYFPHRKPLAAHWALSTGLGCFQHPMLSNHWLEKLCDGWNMRQGLRLNTQGTNQTS